MTPEELQEAEQLLTSRPEFDWLTKNGKPWYNITEVSTNARLSRETVQSLAQGGNIPGAVFYSPSIGWRFARSGLIEYFASLLRGGAGQQAG